MGIVPINQAARQWAVARAVADAMKAAMDAAKPLALDSFHAVGAERVAASLPDGTVVAHVTAVQPKAVTHVVDEAALMEWAVANVPGLVVHVPEQVTVVPAHDELNAKLLGDVLPYLTTTPTGHVVDDNGEVIPGLRHEVTKDPYLSVRFVDGGRDAVLRAVATGLLAEALQPELPGETSD